MSSKTKSGPTCMDDYDPNSLSMEQAKQQIHAAITPVSEQEEIAIENALSRVLAEPVVSPINVPPYTNSAMDGYAIKGNDIPAEGEKELQVVGVIMAGKPIHQQITSGQCARIMTGAKMPEGTDTVVMQEHVTVIDSTIIIDNRPRPGQHVRHAGEDISLGQTILPRMRRLTAADIGLLASLGISSVNVVRPLRVAFFSTGDELAPVGSELKEGQIYDSNRYTLAAMLRQFGAEIIDLGVIKDKRQDVEDAFTSACQQADMVITSGGVSVGDADYVKETLEKLGQVNFWKIAMKPGRPLAFGKINDCFVFGLPGNPVSVMVTFYQFVLPALQLLQCETPRDGLTLNLSCTTPLRKIAGRIEYQRGIMESNDSGELTVRSVGGQGSHILSSMSKANCFIILPVECEQVEVGEIVKVQPFCGLI